MLHLSRESQRVRNNRTKNAVKPAVKYRDNGAKRLLLSTI